MSIKKTVAIAAAAGALAAVAVPAMAVENEFHGMYTFSAYQTNFFEGTTLSPYQAAGLLKKDAPSGFFAEQRARVQYIAKANADLKLVTHFELDSRFGGKATKTDGTAGYLGTTGNDSGSIDADQLTLETKSVYLDVNCPITGANVKVGMQPWADSYQSLFLLADMTGVYATKKFGPATASLGWFRFDDNDFAATYKNTGAVNAAGNGGPGKKTADLIVVDGKYNVNKDLTVGASYYNIQNDTGIGQVADTATAASAMFNYELLHMIGLNADINVGPANIKPFAAFQFGDINAKYKMSGMLLGATSKTKIGAGAINASAVYMSGDNAAGQEKSFRTVGPNYTYFNAANMWLLVRNGSAVNSSTSILGNDMTAGGAGLLGLFAGYEGTMGKVFYNANIGYAQADKVAAGMKKGIGTELNAQVGYNVYDNLSASAAVAYAILGDAFDASKADDPYAINLMLKYAF